MHDKRERERERRRPVLQDIGFCRYGYEDITETECAVRVCVVAREKEDGGDKTKKNFSSQ